MKLSGLGIICTGLLMISGVSFAAGPYEIGRMSVDGTECVWTSNIKKNCTKDEMQKKAKAMEDCLSPKLEKETESCKDMKCVRERIKTIATSCCNQTGGTIK